MPRTCTICAHDNRPDINKALVERQLFRNIAVQFKVSNSALVRRSDDHLPSKLLKAQAAREAADADAYIEEHGIELPKHYGEGVRDSFECWCCPAMADDGAPKRLEYLQRSYPELYCQVRPAIDSLNETVRTAAGRFERLARP